MRKPITAPFVSAIALIALALAMTVSISVPVAGQTTPPTTITATVETGGPRLRVRAEPGFEHAIIARLEDGQVVNALARTTSGAWILVPVPEPATPYGWVSTAFVRLSAPVVALPIANSTTAFVPPAPAPTVPVTPVPGVALIPAGRPGLYGKLAVPVFDEKRKTYDVWLVNADGTGLRKVVEQASAPALSYDGSQLAYRHWQVDDRGIVVAASDGSRALRLTDKLEDTLPAFAPDRTRTAFSSYREGDRKIRLYYAWTDEQNLTAWEWGPGIFGEDPYWMADGRILFRVTRPNREAEELWIMNGDASDQSLLFITPSLRAPAAAPDGRTVVYMALAADASGSDNWEIYSFDLVERTVHRLTQNAARDGLPVWSPNGEYIAFVSDRGGRWGLWIMEPDGTNVARVVELPGPVDGFVEFEPEYLNRGWLEEQIDWKP